MTTEDINTIGAGDYELVAELWDQRTSKLGEPFDFTRHRRGDIVTLNVDDAKRLYAAGAVVRPGARERQIAELQLAAFKASLDNLDDETRRQLLSTLSAGSTTEAAATVAAGAVTPPAGDDAPTGGKPKQVAAKGEWVAYAVTQGMTEAEADALTKEQLIEKYRDS